jgi:hypothetical protein
LTEDILSVIVLYSVRGLTVREPTNETISTFSVPMVPVLEFDRDTQVRDTIEDLVNASRHVLECLNKLGCEPNVAPGILKMLEAMANFYRISMDMVARMAALQTILCKHGSSA